jgi:hypothetical protein
MTMSSESTNPSGRRSNVVFPEHDGPSNARNSPRPIVRLTSAIATFAPVIGANGEDVYRSIAFTAVLGVIVVLALPTTPALLHFSGLQYGILAGLTVYAMPQVLAAPAPLVRASCRWDVGQARTRA